MCGIVGIVGTSAVNNRIYDALTVLQHRGQDAAGIATSIDGEHWWTRSLLIPYGESVANGLRGLVGEQRVRHSGGITAKN